MARRWIITISVIIICIAAYVLFYPAILTRLGNMKLFSVASVTYEEVINDRSIWPKEVTTKASVQVPIIYNGEKVGFYTTSARKTYKVSALNSSSIELLINDQKVLIDPKDTDILDRAKYLPRKKVPAIVVNPATAPSPDTVVSRDAQQADKNERQTPKTPDIAPILNGSVSKFFKIENVRFLKNEPNDKIGVWRNELDGKGRISKYTFLPCIEVSVRTEENIDARNIYTRLYFFDKSKKIICTLNNPSKSGKQGEAYHETPVIFPKNDKTRLFFEIPEQLKNKELMAVVVFGDTNEATMGIYPPTASSFMLDYPEKKLVEAQSIKKVDRKSAMDPLIEHVVKTKNTSQSQITLFLRMPKGIANPSEIQGVMAICVLAGSADGIKREMQKPDMSGDYAGLFPFADEHKLAILAWGSSSLWDSTRNYDEMEHEAFKEMEKSLDQVADAWERGVLELSEKYKIPKRNYLLWGCCGSAQWAQRLCLRKPDYFLAVDIHMPGSYDKPTPEASKVLWCLTIGELEGGYERSKRFYAECRRLGYPMIYKSIPNLGHATNQDARDIVFKFFEFALSQKDLRAEYDRKTASSIDQFKMASSGIKEPWPEAFRKPPFYGDMVNQEMFTAAEVDLIPSGYRVPLPTKEVAEIWNRSQ